MRGVSILIVDILGNHFVFDRIQIRYLNHFNILGRIAVGILIALPKIECIPTWGKIMKAIFAVALVYAMLNGALASAQSLTQSSTTVTKVTSYNFEMEFLVVFGNAKPIYVNVYEIFRSQGLAAYDTCIDAIQEASALDKSFSVSGLVVDYHGDTIYDENVTCSVN